MTSRDALPWGILGLKPENDPDGKWGEIWQSLASSKIGSKCLFQLWSDLSEKKTKQKQIFYSDVGDVVFTSYPPTKGEEVIA